MSRHIVSSLALALAVAALPHPGVAQSPAPSPPPLGDEAMTDAIESTLDKIFQDGRGAVVRVESHDDFGKVAGTGFFADASGTIYTHSSVVGDGMDLTVTQGERKFPARLLAKDKRTGIALIKVDGAGVTPFLVCGDSRELKVSSPIIVIGYPYDHDATPSFGIVGGFDRKSKGKFFTTTHIRANIPVQRGEGGSPVLNLDGEVVGIVVSGFEKESGCYVLPMAAAEKVRTHHERFGDVRHGWAGVTVQEIPVPVQGSRLAIDVVDPHGPAAAAGFLPGDVLLQVGDIVVREPEDALDASFFLTPGDPVGVRVARGSSVLQMPFTPAVHPADRDSDLQALGTGSLAAPPAASP